MPANIAVTGAITKKKAAISPSPVMIDSTVVSQGQGRPANSDRVVSTPMKIATNRSGVRPIAFHRMWRKSSDSTSRSERSAASSIGGGLLLNAALEIVAGAARGKDCRHDAMAIV